MKRILKMPCISIGLILLFAFAQAMPRGAMAEPSEDTIGETMTAGTEPDPASQDSEPYDSEPNNNEPNNNEPYGSEPYGDEPYGDEPYDSDPDSDPDIADQESSPKDFERYLVFEGDPATGAFVGSRHWLGDAVALCAKDNAPYTIVATEDDYDMTDYLGADPEGPTHSTGTHAGISITQDKLITVTSDAGNRRIIRQQSNDRHFHVSGELTIENIDLQGMGYGNAPDVPKITNGGVSVSGTLIINAGAIIQKCYSYNSGGGVNARGIIWMTGGSIRDNATAHDGVGGGGVQLHGQFTLAGGSISGNTAINSNGGGVYEWYDGIFVAGDYYGAVGTEPPVISGNHAPNGNGGGIYTMYPSVTVGANVTFGGNDASRAINMNKTAAQMAALYPTIRTTSHSECPRFAAVHPLNNYDISVHILNTRLTVTETVSGDYADLSRMFGFTIAFYNNSDEMRPLTGSFAYYDGSPDIPGSAKLGALTLDVNGTAKFEIKHGDAIVIDGVPTDCCVRIVQYDYSTLGYSPSHSDSGNPDSLAAPIKSRDTGLLTMAADERIVSFSNTRSIVPTNVNLGDSRTAILLTASALLCAIIVLMRSAKRKWIGLSARKHR